MFSEPKSLINELSTEQFFELSTEQFFELSIEQFFELLSKLNNNKINYYLRIAKIITLS